MYLFWSVISIGRNSLHIYELPKLLVTCNICLKTKYKVKKFNFVYFLSYGPKTNECYKKLVQNRYFCKQSFTITYKYHIKPQTYLPKQQGWASLRFLFFLLELVKLTTFFKLKFSLKLMDMLNSSVRLKVKFIQKVIWFLQKKINSLCLYFYASRFLQSLKMEVKSKLIQLKWLKYKLR